MVGFRQFFTSFLMEFINIGPVYIRGWAEGRGGRVCGGKSLIVWCLMVSIWQYRYRVDQSTKLCIVIPYHMLSNFRRGAIT